MGRKPTRPEMMGSLPEKEIASICTKGAKQSAARRMQSVVFRNRKNFLLVLEYAIHSP
jgi:hypothetical protein